MKFKILVILSLIFSLSISSILLADDVRPNVEAKIKSAEVTSSEKWIELTFLITNNTKDPLQYVVVELAGWSKDEDDKRDELMISNNYYSEPVPANNYIEVTFAMHYVKGADIWTAKVIDVRK